MSSRKLCIGPEDVLSARTRLAEIVRETPLLPYSKNSGVRLKAENLQMTGSFKVRAAFNQMSLLSDEEKCRGIVTSSSGNFAQAAACAAKALGVTAKIVMMKSSSPIKAHRTLSHGAEVVFCEDQFEARGEMVAQIQRAENRVPVHPYDHPHAIAGNGTIALEVMDRWEEVENIVVPISGGGLISGVALAAKARNPQVRIWGVQPEGSNATCLSFRAGKAVSIDHAHTAADGLMVTRPGTLTLPIIQALVEDVVVVKEDSILAAVRWLLLEEKLVVEPSGAVPLAAILEGKVPSRATALVLSGGNINPELLMAACRP